MLPGASSSRAPGRVAQRLVLALLVAVLAVPLSGCAAFAYPPTAPPTPISSTSGHADSGTDSVCEPGGPAPAPAPSANRVAAPAVSKMVVAPEAAVVTWGAEICPPDAVAVPGRERLEAIGISRT